MKKLLIVLLILSVILSGCGVKINAPDAEGQSTGPSPTDETFTVIEKDEAVAPTEPVYAQQPMAAVSLPVITELTTAEDGMVVAQSRYQNIHLYVQDQQIADMVIIDFLNRLDTHTAAASALAEEAQQVYSGPYGWSSYLYETIYTPTRIDLSVLSLYGQNVIFTGSNHPQVECSAANYNMITGEVLTLGSILPMKAGFLTITRKSCSTGLQGKKAMTKIGSSHPPA